MDGNILIIDSFTGDYSFLSNFYSCKINYNGFSYLNTEAAFQAQKTLDRDIQKQFTNLNPSQAKKLGRKIPLRKDWEEIKDTVMYEVCKVKFNIPELKEKLIATQDAQLVEGNTWNDHYWGVCNGYGKNQLGKILMKIREELQK